MADPLIQAGNKAVQAVDNNPSQTATDNASYLASNPNALGSTTPTVMSPAQAFNNTPTPVPTVTSPDTSGAIVAGAKQTVDQVTQSLTPSDTPLDTQNQGLLNDVATLTGQDSGKAQAYLDAEKASGATQANADLTALNNKLKTMTASFDQMQANLGGNGSVETSAVLAAQNAGLTKARAADIGMVTAQIQAKQGDLALATKTAHDAVDARYSTIEDNIKTKLAQLDALKPRLDAQHSTQALAQQKILADQERALNDQAKKLDEEKAQAKDNVQLALTAGITTKYVNKNGQFFDAATGQPFSDPASFFKAAGVSSFEEAYQKGLVTDFSKAKIDEQQFVSQLAAKYPDAGIKLNDTQEVAQAKLANSKIYHKETYIAPPAGSGGGSPTSYTPIDASAITDKNAANANWGGLSFNGLANAAKLYLANSGKMPALGLGSSKDTQAKRNAIVNYAGQLADSMGMDINQISTLYKANSKAAGSIIDRVAKIDTTASSLVTQFPRLAQLAGQVGNLGITEADLTAGKAHAESKFGSVDAANYIELIQTVRSDYAAMQTSVAGGRGGQFFAQSAKDAIPLGLTPDQYLGLADTIQTSAMNAKTATADEATSLVNNYSGIGGSTDNSGTVHVKDNATGQTGTIPLSEFDSSKYTKIP